MDYKKIVILGCSGVGKSRFARQLGNKLGLPIIHLDVLFYAPEWQPTAVDVFRARVQMAHVDQRWISEGNFVADTAEIRFPVADIIIWLEQPLWRSLFRAIRRCFVDRGDQAGDLAPGCHDQLNWALVKDIWKFDRFDRPAIEASLKNWASQVKIVRLNGDAAIETFLRSFP